MNLPTGLLARLGQSFEKVLAVHVTDKDVLPAVTPVHGMVDGARILHSHRARHGAEGAKPDGNVNHRNEPQPWRSANLRFDPFPCYRGMADKTLVLTLRGAGTAASKEFLPAGTCGLRNCMLASNCQPLGRFT